MAMQKIDSIREVRSGLDLFLFAELKDGPDLGVLPRLLDEAAGHKVRDDVGLELLGVEARAEVTDEAGMRGQPILVAVELHDLVLDVFKVGLVH